jgi:hypothetical protein
MFSYVFFFNIYIFSKKKEAMSLAFGEVISAADFSAWDIPITSQQLDLGREMFLSYLSNWI